MKINMVGFTVNIKRMPRPGVDQLGIYSPQPISLGLVQPNNQLHAQALPKIFIVIPSFDQGRLVGATLQSIINQWYPNLEIIVIDGESTDNMLSVIEQYDTHIAWWISEPDSGQTAAINKEFARSTGEIIAWINSDDLILSAVLHIIADFFVKLLETQAVYGDKILINEEDLKIGKCILSHLSTKALQWVDFVSQETIYWTRSAWNLIDAQLDEAFRFAMDRDFLLRLSAKHIKIQHLPVSPSLFRMHEQQKISSQMSSIGQEKIRIIRCRELEFQPTRWQLILNTAPFLMAAKFHELNIRLGFARSISV